MEFEPVQLTYETPSGLLDIHVTAEAVEMLWDGNGSAQTGPAIVEQHRQQIEQAVQKKLAGVMTAPTEVIIDEDDLDPA